MSTYPASRLAQRTVRTIAAGLATVVIAASPALAQRAEGFASTVRPAVSAMDAIGVSISRGFHYAGQGRYDLARHEFRDAAARQQRSGYLPETSLWQVAATYYAEDNLRDAARTLDELATVAGQFGDVHVQGKALLEAAFLYRRSGDVERSAAVAREVVQLARSADMSAELRDEITRRIGS